MTTTTTLDEFSGLLATFKQLVKAGMQANLSAWTDKEGNLKAKLDVKFCPAATPSSLPSKPPVSPPVAQSLSLKRLVNRQLADVANDVARQRGRGRVPVLLAIEQPKQLLQLFKEVPLLLQKEIKSVLHRSRLQHLLRHHLRLHQLKLPASSRLWRGRPAPGPTSVSWTARATAR